MKKLVLIGDSIRMGNQDEVRRQLPTEVEIFTPTQNGGDSRNVKSHLQEWVLEQSATVVHLNCGLHDIKREFASQQISVSPEEYRSNLHQILETVTEAAETTIWATTTPVNQDWHHQRKGFDRLISDVLEYNRVAISIAEELRVVVNDLYQTITEAGRDQLLVPDGVHFSPQGSSLLGKAVSNVVSPYLT